MRVSSSSLCYAVRSGTAGRRPALVLTPSHYIPASGLADLDSRGLWILPVLLAILFLRWIVELVLARLNERATLAHAHAVPATFREIMDSNTYAKSIRYTLAKSQFNQLEVTFDSSLLMVLLLTGFCPRVFTGAPISSDLQPPPSPSSSSPCPRFCRWHAFPSTGPRSSDSKPASDSTPRPPKPGGWTAQRRIPQPPDRLPAGLAHRQPAQPGRPRLVVLRLARRPRLPTDPDVHRPGAHPALVQPLHPLPVGSLRERLERLARRTRFQHRDILVMDGSRRSRHSNAFFTGLGRFRRIVLYDTLVSQLQEDELEAVLAHEIGHCRLGHVPRMLAASALSSFLLFFLFGQLADPGWFLEAFGFQSAGIGPLLLLALSLRWRALLLALARGQCMVPTLSSTRPIGLRAGDRFPPARPRPAQTHPTQPRQSHSAPGLQLVLLLSSHPLGTRAGTPQFRAHPSTLRKNLIQQQINDHPGHGDINPHRPGPARDPPMPLKLPARRPINVTNTSGNNTVARIVCEIRIAR
jgi:STE24 endopeptidase